MISVILYGRNDSYGYNLHKRGAISFNCIAEVLNDPDDEIIFVDTNTPDDLPTFPEAIRDTLTARAKKLLRILRVRPASYEKFKNGTRMKVLEPLCRNVGIRRANPRNRWVLNSNTDMVFVPLKPGQSLSEAVADLRDGLYELPRFEMPEMLWESLDRSNPQVIMERFAHWGRRLHINESVKGGRENIFDAPGDFQLAPRDQLFAIHGMNEQMVLGWHVDSNLCRRLFLLNGTNYSLLERYHAYHCDHTRVNTMMHTAEGGTSNDWRVFCTNVTSPYLPDQAKTWGMPNEPIEEIRLTDDQGNRYTQVLERLLPGMQEPMLQSALIGESYNDGLFYDNQHVLPYLTDHLGQIPPTADIGYFGGNAALLKLMAEFRLGFGHAGRVLYDPNVLETGGAGPGNALPDNCVATDFEGISKQAFVFCLDLWMGNFPFLKNRFGYRTLKPSDEAMRFCALMMHRLHELARREKARYDADPHQTRKFILLGSQHAWIGNAVEQLINVVLTPYSSYVRHGVVRKDAFTKRFQAVPSHFLFLGDDPGEIQGRMEKAVGRPLRKFDFVHTWLHGDAVRCGLLDLESDCARKVLLGNDLGRAVLRIQASLAEIDGLIARGTQMLQAAESAAKSADSEVNAATPLSSPPPARASARALAGTPTIGIDLRILGASAAANSRSGRYTQLHVQQLIRSLPNWNFQLYLDSATPPPAAAPLLVLPNAKLCRYADYRPGDIDLFHVPDPFYRTPGLRSPLQLIPDVLASAMVPDLSCLRFDGGEEKLAEQLEDIQRLGQLLESRFRVLTLSEFTRREFLKATGCAENKAAAVYSGLYPITNSKITPAAIRAVRQKYGLKNRMLLHLGPVERGNNFELVITAFGQLRASDLDLIVVGERNRSLGELAAMVRDRNLGIVFPGAIPDGDLELLYHDAVALISLSSLADYSFPFLEAMAQGCPVIATREACFPELVEDVAMLFAPDDIKGVAGCLGQLLRSAPSRKELAEKGRARASQFTWEATARKTIAVWEEMLATARKATQVAAAVSTSMEVPVSRKFDEAVSLHSAQPNAAPEVDVAYGEKGAADGPIAVAWEGSYLDFGSLSHVNRELTKELQHRPGVALSRVMSAKPANVHPKLEKLARELVLAALPGTQITIRHGWPPNWSRPASGALVVMQPWEFGALPEEWVRESSAVQAFWVPTEFVRQAFIESGVPAAKVQVVPNGINPAVFHPDARPLKLTTAKSFKLLFVGGTIHRKGADVLLEAYLGSFSAKDDVCLVIKDFGTKSFYAGQTLGDRIRAAQATPGAPEILYLDGELAPDELPGLYTACDCLAHPYRGEGFGLTILEAMACGLPGIITAGGAADEFAGDFAYLVKATRKSIGQSISGAKLTGPGWLLEPDPMALAEQMKHVFANREEARDKGRRASEHARQDWTWERAARIAAQKLRMLQAQNVDHLVRQGEEVSEHADVNGAPAAAVDTNASEAAKPASKVPACALVGQLTTALDLFKSQKLAEAWEATLAALQERPFHPEAFLLLAEIALAAGDSSSARRCAQRASDMAPQCPAALRFLRSKLRGNAKPAWLTLPESVSGEVKPRLSLCMIVKNEERFLGQCLNSVRGLADQIVVVDTGSTDRTVEIAREHGAEVHPFQWCDDFSAARNAALEHARGDWVLVLDADEELQHDQHEALRKLMNCREVIAWRLPIAEVGREQESRAYVPRLFRNAPSLFYVSRVHEQVFGSIELRRREWGLDNRLGDAALRHHGYRPEIMQDRKKVERNLRLLERALEEYPSEPFLLMNYGLELVRSGQPTKGLESYRKAFEAMSVEEPPETREMLLAQYSTHLMRAEQFEQVVRVLESPLAKAGDLNASLHFTLGLAHLKLKRSSEAAVQMRQCLEKRHLPSMSSVNKDIHTVAPQYCLALALDQLGETANAAQEFERAVAQDPKSRPVRLDYARFLAAHGKAAEAIKLLLQLTAELPEDVAVWVQGGRLALSKPEFLEVARHWTAEARRRAPLDPIILRQRAEALLLSGQCDAALPLWRQLQVGSDSAGLAALVICETIVGESQASPDPELEASISREFLKWYRRLVTYKAQAVLLELNGRLEQWQNQLPTAARALSAALAEAQETVPV